MDRALASFATIGATPGETEDQRLRRVLLVGVALVISLLAIFWGLVYIAFGEPLGGAIPRAYSVLLLLRIVRLTITRGSHVFRMTQPTLMLFRPFSPVAMRPSFTSSTVFAPSASCGP